MLVVLFSYCIVNYKMPTILSIQAFTNVICHYSMFAVMIFLLVPLISQVLNGYLGYLLEFVGQPFSWHTILVLALYVIGASKPSGKADLTPRVKR